MTFTDRLADDLQNLMTDPSYEGSERMWRLVYEWKQQYPESWKSVIQHNRMTFLLLSRILEVGQEMGWEEKYEIMHQPESPTSSGDPVIDGLV
jgi:hypothetical protein